MERKKIEEMFKLIGSRVTIRTGTSSRRSNAFTLNVTNDKKGEHFTITVHPKINEHSIVVQLLDYDDKLKQMLLYLKFPQITGEVWGRNGLQGGEVTKEFTEQRLLVGHDEMHWFVAGVTGAKNIREAFARLRPERVTVSMLNAGVKIKDRMKRKNKGFVRQGEWFFVPVDYHESKSDVIHKNERLIRPGGGKPHVAEEVIRKGGEAVFVNRTATVILTKEEYDKLHSDEKNRYRQQVRGAMVLARGKIKHSDHHTLELKTWHEVHVSTEAGVSSNAFID